MENTTKQYMDIHGVENSVTMPIFKPSWNTGVVAYKDTSGLNVRFIQPKGEAGEFQATLANIPALTGFDLNAFANRINNGDFDNPPNL